MGEWGAGMIISLDAHMKFSKNELKIKQNKMNKLFYYF